MSEQLFDKNPDTKSAFWSNATKYAASEMNDQRFVNEIAYLLVTLHRTGA